MYQVSIKAARVNANLTQQEAAKSLGITARTLHNWEEQKTAITVDTIKKLCDLYSVPIEMIRL